MAEPAPDPHRISTRASDWLKWVKSFALELGPYAHFLRIILGALRIVIGALENGCKEVEAFSKTINSDET